MFEGDGLDAANLLTFYEDGARTARRTEKLQVSDTTVGGAAAKRLDVLGSDGTGQTIVTWPADVPGRVNVLLAADLGDARVADALDALGGDEGRRTATPTTLTTLTTPTPDRLGPRQAPERAGQADRRK